MKAKKCDDSSYGKLIAEIGRLFINKPYKAETLENIGKEKLIVNVSAFDCMTFVETVLALALCVLAGNISRNEFRKKLISIRYREGEINGYSSRLHYFTDWLYSNENKKILTDVTCLIGGEPKHKKINFMTAHCQLYPALKNEMQFSKMLAVEKSLSRSDFYIIKKDKVNMQKGTILNGDIIAFTTDQEGLDVAHVGFALRQGKHLHLLHASKKEGAVVISKKTLVAYLKSNKKFTGIIVARLLQHSSTR
jgi:hypothetical protein